MDNLTPNVANRDIRENLLPDEQERWDRRNEGYFAGDNVATYFALRLIRSRAEAYATISDLRGKLDGLDFQHFYVPPQVDGEEEQTGVQPEDFSRLLATVFGLRERVDILEVEREEHRQHAQDLSAKLEAVDDVAHIALRQGDAKKALGIRILRILHAESEVK